MASYTRPATSVIDYSAPGGDSTKEAAEKQDTAINYLYTNIVDATDTAKGISARATAAKVAALTDEECFVTPGRLPIASDSQIGLASFDADDFTATDGDVAANKLMKTAATGVWRRAYLLIEDGTNASTLKCSVASQWNGDTVSAEDNVPKDGNTTSFALNASGNTLYIYGSALTGTILDAGFLGFYPTSGVVGTTLNPRFIVSGGNIVITFRTPAGASIDMTTEIGTGTNQLEFYYITSE